LEFKELTHSGDGRQRRATMGGAKRAALYAMAGESVMQPREMEEGGGGGGWKRQSRDQGGPKQKVAVQEMPRRGRTAQKLLTGKAGRTGGGRWRKTRARRWRAAGGVDGRDGAGERCDGGVQRWWKEASLSPFTPAIAGFTTVPPDAA
jgi:hypothetical protein